MDRRKVDRGCLLLTLAALSLIGRPARAEGTADEADAHFVLAQADYRKGAYDSALTHFLQSNRLAPNRNVLFNIASTYEALRRYSDAYRYYVDALEGETDSKQRANVDAAIRRMAPEVAILDVVSDPPGATIYSDRKDLGSLGRTPRSLALPPGKHQIIVEHEGFEPRTAEEVELTVGKPASLSLALTRIVGHVRIRTDAGVAAEVRIDDESSPPRCTTPCDLDLRPGRHDIWLHAPRFEAAVRSVVVEPNRTAVTSVKLVPLVGSLVIRTEERDATVFVDGQPMGFTPLVARGIPAGKHDVRIELRDYMPLRTTIDVRANEQTELMNVVLEPLREVRAASRTAESIDDAPSSVTIIDRREMSAFGYPTMYEAIRGVRGIALSNDRVFPVASVRGIGQPGDFGNRFLVLSNGQSLNENVGASSYIGHEARADLDDVERIEIARGPGSLLYGTGAISGVLNLVLRPPDSPDEVHAASGVYDDRVAHARAGVHLNFGPGRSVWASVSGARSGGFDLGIPVDGAPAGNPPVARGVEAFDTIGTAGQITLRSLTGQWFYHERHQSLPVGWYGTTLGDSTTKIYDQRFTGEVRYEPRITDELQIFARAHGSYYRARDTYAYPEGISSDDLTGVWLGAEARLVYAPTPWLRLTAGGEAQFHPEASIVASTEVSGDTKVFLDERHPYVLGAGYALAEGSPWPWLRFSAGARVDVYSTFGAVVVPRAAVILKPAPGHAVKIMGGRAFRAPSVYELFYNDGGQTQVTAQDPSRGLSLAAESSVSGEIEYSWRFLPSWVALAAAHTTYMEGTIGLSPDMPGSRLVRYSNSEVPVLVVGGDLELRREWRRGLLFAASYGYQRAQALDAAAGNPLLENAPEHLASVRLVVPVVTDIASLGFRATLEAPRRIRADSDETTRTAIVADATVSGFVSDLAVRYVVGVYNFADWQYDVPIDGTFLSRTMPQNGRRFLLSLKWALP